MNAAQYWKEQWDKSSLKFIDCDGNKIILGSNGKANISVKIKNTGENMAGETTYELYYSKSGNPKDGTKIAAGTINPLKKG
ncbi:hypothetical protein BpJC7_31440 [Weizmannia acidilactici]|uniref:CARDB domain-containing protein n=1 Tax=Weizmannia acidilactici TaxID=2607726 RepID=A0A5J4JJ88_9BACI|nr:hypothetical protein [Weizmannia acidilactici]GER68551.1 hypothetical protein BpJC4_30220 [Weizmannia acidilactici]GER71841.1 hypothetical protein BpJC7_31440 [Weizmannia acidilactici]GER75044.1 hypothetical protein BpPP18_31110 [Weizmannia acidilactici]